MIYTITRSFTRFEKSLNDFLVGIFERAKKQQKYAAYLVVCNICGLK